MNTNIMNMTALRMWRRSSPASVLNPRAQMSLMSLNFKQIFKFSSVVPFWKPQNVRFKIG